MNQNYCFTMLCLVENIFIDLSQVVFLNEQKIIAFCRPDHASYNIMADYRSWAWWAISPQSKKSIYTLKKNTSTVSFNVIGDFFFSRSSYLSFLSETPKHSFFTLILCWIMSSLDRSEGLIKSGNKNVMHHRYFFIYQRHLKIH